MMLRRGLTSVLRRSLSSARPEPYQTDDLTSTETRRIYNEDHDALRDTCRRFFTDEVVPEHTAWEKVGQVPRELWNAAGSVGLLGVSTAEEHGGMGLDKLSAAVVWEEQAYTGCTGPGFSLHSDIVMPYIEHYGSQEMKEKYLPKMASGECIGAIAMSEPGAGSDLMGVRTMAKKDGDDWILSGQKTFITNGAMCDAVIVVAQTETDPKMAAKGITLFVVDAGTPGFEKGRKLDKVGLKAQDTSELFFEDVRLPSSAVLGEVGSGFKYLMTELPQERLLIAAMGICSAEAAFEWTRAYTKDRKAFQTPLVKMPTIRHELARIKTTLAATRAFTDQCLELHNEGRLDTATASMVKAHATDVQNDVATRCLQLFGGYGYMMEYPIARQFLDARVQSIYGGTNEIMMEVVSREIAK